MSNVSDVRSLVATMLLLSPDQIDGNTSLKTLNNSLSGTRLSLGLKRLGFKPVFRKVPATFGELERILTGVEGVPESPDPQASVRPVQPRRVSSSASSRIGHDIQDMQSLPNAIDYWEHEFYAGSFTPEELAYAVVHSEPKEHFAGFWAAKEALRKCDPSFADIGFKQITVAHDVSGAPYFLYHEATDVRLMHSLSISHTGTTASAVVLAEGMSATAAEVSTL